MTITIHSAYVRLFWHGNDVISMITWNQYIECINLILKWSERARAREKWRKKGTRLIKYICMRLSWISETEDVKLHYYFPIEWSRKLDYKKKDTKSILSLSRLHLILTTLTRLNVFLSFSIVVDTQTYLRKSHYRYSTTTHECQL